MEQVQELPNTKKRRGGASILCPQCDRPTRVVETRRNKDDGSVRRERICLSCHDVFDTIEKYLPTTRPCTAPAWRAVMGIKQ